MQFLLDHIASVVISGIVILVILAVVFRGRSSSIESSQYYAQKKFLMDFVDVMERDFNNVGAGWNPASTSIQNLDTSGATKFFQFMARPDSSLDTAAVIRYEWTQSGTVTLKNASTIPVYTVQRLVNGNYSGSATDVITGFRVDLFTADSVSIAANYQDTRLVRVDVRVISPMGTGDEIEQSQWTKMFRPVNLTRTN